MIAPHLQHIFNNCISQSNFPACLKIAQVIPLYKKDDPEEPSNYRPISITPCISKVFELLIRDQIVEHLNRNKILTNSQYGFRKKYSTTDALMYCTEFIRNEINQKRSVAAAFLDLSKAFDSIDHTVLNQKLVEVGFNTNACKLLSSFLYERSQTVKLGEIESDSIILERGVPQGTVLGPLLFN